MVKELASQIIWESKKKKDNQIAHIILEVYKNKNMDTCISNLLYSKAIIIEKPLKETNYAQLYDLVSKEFEKENIKSGKVIALEYDRKEDIIRRILVK